MDQSLFSAAANGILTRLISLAGEEIKLAWGFKGEFKRLSGRFETAQLLLSYAESRQTAKPVQDWLKKLNDVARDADDVLDEFAFEELRRKLELQNRLKNKVRNFFSLSNPLAFRLKMAHKVKNICSMFDEIYKEANEIGLRPVDAGNTSVEQREIRLTHPFVDDLEVVGRSGDISVVIEKLLSSHVEDHLPVISIVGLAGLGKTTLAQLVYNDEKVVRNFSERMWVCVSDEFNVRRLLNEMVESLTKTSSEMLNMEAIVKKLRESLEGKNYLLVLDDVWNEIPEKWEEMRNSLLGIGGFKGSKIIITTRSDEVAKTMQASFIHHLEGLLDDDCWTIFKKRAFAKGGPEETLKLVDVGRRIVKRCGGMPLAIKTLGALMHSKKNEHDWLLIERSEIWNLYDETHVAVIFRSLRLSFHHLPLPSLRECFAYCSIFPKDFDLQRNNLIELWMAQGYLQPTKGSNMLMEDVGSNYFDILLWNSLLQDTKEDEYETITGCKMHDLVHDFAIYISNNYCLTLKAAEMRDVSNVQHLSMVSNAVKVQQISNANFQKLRTLVLRGNLLRDISMDSTCLRVLKLARIEKLSSSISKMIHLKYLDISRTSIKVLPNFICKLYNLQTLRMLYCRFLEELPKDFKKLINLRHFYMDDDEKHRKIMPTGLGQLTHLQTLPFFVVSHGEGCGIDELGCLSNLKGTLKIYGLEHVKSKEDAQKAKLSSNQNIQELRLHWSGGREENVNINEDEEVLEGLNPLSNLKGLVIENFGGGKLASWMMVRDHSSPLYNLVKMELKYCRRLEQIPALGHIPSLKVLRIEGMLSVKRIGREFYGSDNFDGGSKETAVFRALRELKISDLPNLVEWCEAEAADGMVFPRLEELDIRRCPLLRMAPSHSPSIKKLKAENINNVALKKMCSKLTSLTFLDLVQILEGSEINITLEEMFKNNTSLQEVSICFCDGLASLPNSLQNLVSLERLSINGCRNLTTISSSVINSLTRLQCLTIMNCKNLICLPEGIGNLASLEILSLLSCPNLTSIIMPSDILKLTSLRNLSIVECGILTVSSSNCWPEWLLSLTPSLRSLWIGGLLEELDYFPWPTITTSSSDMKNITLQSQQCHHDLFVSLKSLRLHGWPKLKSLPDQLQDLTALTDLAILQFDGLEALPDWLGNLSLLQSLSVSCCNNLKDMLSARAMRRLTSLRSLRIIKCPLLKERCSKGSGLEWHKISHIPSIEIDWEYIQLKY